MNKTGRNESCPCGSGKKYKKCCLRDNKSETALIENAQKNLIQKANKRLGKNIIFTGQQELKMSEVILEFADDLLDQAKTEEQKHTAIATACTAWNLSLLDEKKRDEELEKIRRKLSKDDQQSKEDITSIFYFLIKRKLDEYADIKRFIAAYEFTDMGGHLRLDIASTII